MSGRKRLISACCAAAISGLALGGHCRSAELVTLRHQDIARTAVLHRPATARPGPLPLVVALHGIGGTGEGMRRLATFDAVAEREGFAVAYPDAVDKRWSYGRPINQPMPTIAAGTVDDVGFIRVLIDDLVARNIADSKRVYVTGMSRGGLMAFTLACALADTLAAAAPLITGMSEYQRDDCRPARPVPIMVIAGTNDFEQAYDGWLLPAGRLLSVPESMEFWRALHGCTEQKQEMLPDRAPFDRTRVLMVSWSKCRTAARILLYRVLNGGHQLPSMAESIPPLPEQRFGLRSRDIETAEEVWAFFKAHAR
jgi:polyhydroxybutyrate depolymerase